MADGAEPVRVFVSYAHDDAGHEDRVRDFWLFLRANGLDARLDLPAAEEPRDWTLWMGQQLRECQFVLVVGSPGYKRRAEGARARHVLAEFCELAPFGKLLFSADTYLLPVRYLVGAAQFRSSLGVLLDGWVADSAISTTDAARIARMIASGNARRLYRLDH